MIVVHHTPRTGYESRHFSFCLFLITTSSTDDCCLQSSREEAASGRRWLFQNLTALLSPLPTFPSQVLPSCTLLWKLSLEGCSQQPLRGPFLPWGVEPCSLLHLQGFPGMAAWRLGTRQRTWPQLKCSH